jgi:hypothetical protein
VSLPTLAPPPAVVPSIGDIVYLASALFRVRVGALATPPDTPNQYTADIKVMGDQGDMSLDAIKGPPGPNGQQCFAFRRQDDANVNGPEDLPTNLTDSQDDLGKYWLIDTVEDGVVTMETAWTWYGTTQKWRTFMMGTFGPPGPMPDITVGVTLIDPSQKAYIDGGGSTTEPTWEIYEPQPAGIPGTPMPLYVFPDVDQQTVSPVQYDLLAYRGRKTSKGAAIWEPLSIKGLLPTPWSMPEGSFAAYEGVSQRAYIGAYSVPPQPFAWTPVVWGHLGGTLLNPVASSNGQQLLNVSALGGNFTLTVLGHTTPPIPYNASPTDIVSALENLASVGIGNVIGTIQGTASTLLEFVNDLGAQVIEPIITNPANLIPDVADAVINVIDEGGNLINDVVNMLTGDPLMIGAQVLLGDPVNGTQVARGLGNVMGRVTIMPHYSNGNSKNQVITPTNNYAVVPANHTGYQGTLFVNLWNDGMLGYYNFNPQGSQLYIQAVPIEIAQDVASGA